MKNRLSLMASLLLVALLLILPLGFRGYYLYVASLVFIYAIGAVGLDLLMGFTGQICFSQAAFFGVGAYGTGILLKWNVPFGAATIAGGVLAAVAGLAIGLPALRIRGHYLALATMAFAGIVHLALIHGEFLTGGPRGLLVERPHWPISFEGDLRYYYLVLLVALLMYILARNILHSRVGRTFIAIRENEIVSQSFGIHVPSAKALVFVISSFYAGIAGGLYGSLVGFLDPLSFGIMESAFFVMMIVIGGRGTLAGAIVGAAFFIVLPEGLRGFEKVEELFFGLIAIVCLIFMPGGIVGLAEGLAARFRARRPGVNQPDSPVGALRPSSEYPISLRQRIQMPDDTATFFRVHRVSIRFGGLHALTDVGLVLNKGDIYSLIGPNGAGKTTLLNIITGLYRADTGTVEFRDLDILGLRAHQIVRAGISRTFQHVDLFPALTARENVITGSQAFTRTGVFGAAFRLPGCRRERRWERARAEEILRLVGILALADQKAGDLSFGEQKLVGLGRALTSEPDLLILDEPAAGMSPWEREGIMDLILSLRKEMELTVLLVEHDMNMVMQISDRIGVLNFGNLIAEGTPREVKSNPQVVEAYLGTEEV